MQILVSLIPETPVHLSFTYYSRMAAALYQALGDADKPFAEELHEGSQHRNRIKLFAFSPLHSRMTEVHKPDKENNIEGGLVFKGPTFFKLSSPWPELVNRVGEGLLTRQNLRIGSQLFRVGNARIIPAPTFRQTMVWRPTKTGSIVTSWSPKNKNTKLYAFPDQPADGQACETLLRTNLVHKWKRLCEIRNDLAEAWITSNTDNPRDVFTPDNISVTFLDSEKYKDKNYKTRLHYIKHNPVRSWQAHIKVTAPIPIQRIAWACGLGEMNSMGFGLMEEVKAP